MTTNEDLDTIYVRLVRSIFSQLRTLDDPARFRRRIQRWIRRLKEPATREHIRALIAEIFCSVDRYDFPPNLIEIVDCSGDRWELLRALTLLGFASADPHPSKEISA